MNRVRRGFKLAGVSWRVIVAEPAILLVLAVGFAGMVVVSGGLFLLLFRRIPTADDLQFPNYLLALPVLWLGSVVTTYCNVVVTVMADRRLRGGEPTVADGMAVATQKLNRIFSWTLVSVAVGLVLQVIAERFRVAGAITSRLFGVAWSLATMFVIPVLALEDASVRRLDPAVRFDLQVQVGRVGRGPGHHRRGDDGGGHPRHGVRGGDHVGVGPRWHRGRSPRVRRAGPRLRCARRGRRCRAVPLRGRRHRRRRLQLRTISTTSSVPSTPTDPSASTAQSFWRQPLRISAVRDARTPAGQSSWRVARAISMSSCASTTNTSNPSLSSMSTVASTRAPE